MSPTTIVLHDEKVLLAKCLVYFFLVPTKGDIVEILSNRIDCTMGKLRGGDEYQRFVDIANVMGAIS